MDYKDVVSIINSRGIDNVEVKQFYFSDYSEDPMSIFNVSKIKNKNGTVISPPPIPNKPAKKPTGKAVSIIKIIKNEYSFDSIELINLTYLMHPWS